MRSMTQREFEARMAWIEEDQDTPSKSDWYLMQIAMEIVRSRAKDPSKIHLNDMRLKREKKAETPKSIEEAAAASKSRWSGAVGLSKRKK